MLEAIENKLTDNLHYAGFSSRLFASNIDVTILLFVYFTISLFLDNNQILYLVCFAINTLYFAVLESSDWQGTLGKRYNKLKVVDKDGEPIVFVIATIRILTKYISLILLPLSIILIYVRRDRRSLHDLVLKTYIIKAAKD